MTTTQTKQQPTVLVAVSDPDTLAEARAVARDVATAGDQASVSANRAARAIAQLLHTSVAVAVGGVVATAGAMPATGWSSLLRLIGL